MNNGNTRRLPDPENDDGPYELDEAGAARAMLAERLLSEHRARTLVVIDPEDPDPCDLAGADWNEARDNEPDEPEGD